MFLNPLMLAGLGGAVVPLLLHLLARSRYKTVEWGAMMFLAGADSRQRQSAKLKQAVLLAMRMAMVALLAIGLARPVVQSSWGMLAQEGPISAVIILDRSYSLNFDEGGRSRFELARDAAVQILAGLRPGDRAALILAGDAQAIPYDKPTADLQAAARLVTDLKPPTGTMDLAAAMDKAADLLEHAPGVGREVYIVADRQAASWSRIDPVFASAWRKRVSAAPARVIYVPVGSEQSDNVAIESVKVLNPPLIRDTRGEVEVRVRNYSPRRTPATPLSLTLLNGNADEVRNVRRSSRLITLDPRSSATFRLPIESISPHAQAISARLDAGGLLSDNRFDLAINVIDRPKVLVISGDERETSLLRSESGYLRMALAPFPRGGSGNPADVIVRRLDEWPAGGMREFNVVVLANVPQFTVTQARALEQFVYEGGGLLVAPGNLCRMDNYNALLWRNGAGLLPARLAPAGTGESAAPTHLASCDEQHPMFRTLRLDRAAGASIVHWFSTSRSADARVLLSLGTGDPYAIEGGTGRGRVILLTSPLDAEWNDLPLSSFYLPFMQSALRYLGSAGAAVTRNVEPGEPILATIPGNIDERDVNVRTPDGRPMNRAALQASPLGDRTQIRYADTATPGWYRVDVRGQAFVFVSQLPQEESDITPMEPQRLQHLMEMLDMRTIDPSSQSLGRAVARARSGAELWLACVAVAVALGLIELWAAGRWGQA